MERKMKRILPGECMKFLQVDFDNGIEKFDFFEELEKLLDNANVKVQKRRSTIANTVKWERYIASNIVDSNNEIDVVVEKEVEKNVMIIWNWTEVVEKIDNQSLSESLRNISTCLPNKKLSLIMYGMEGYFAYHRANNKRKNLEAMYYKINEIPKIARKEFECALVEAQITLNCHITLVESCQEMCLNIFQHSKAIAEISYKKVMREIEWRIMDLYAMGDKKNTIKVDVSGFGLKRLWLRHLCLFNNAGLATAEAICAIYPSPLQLVKEYIRCTPEEGEELLKNIEIRRGPREICRVQKIGSELSVKIYRMFTSLSGECHC